MKGVKNARMMRWRAIYGNMQGPLLLSDNCSFEAGMDPSMVKANWQQPSCDCLGNSSSCFTPGSMGLFSGEMSGRNTRWQTPSSNGLSASHACSVKLKTLTR